MKKILYYILLIAVFSACESQLDITPKGKTVLGTVADLETLLNQTYSIGGGPVEDLGVICNESYSYMKNVSELLANKNTLEYAFLAYDEKVDRALLTPTDGRYSGIYKWINYMNVILDKLDDAEGDFAHKEVIGAECRIMRAYLHWLAVNIYAAQYDEATAAKAGGIAYVTDIDVSKQKNKQTIAEVYEQILEDCSDENIAKLPDVAPNVARGGKAWGNAVRAKVLMQMKKYAEALPYALKSLEYNGIIEDRSSGWSLPQHAQSNLMYMMGTVPGLPLGEVLSVETVGLFEPGDYVKDHTEGMVGDGSWSATYGKMMGGVLECVIYFDLSNVLFVNAYGITSDRMYYTAAECYIRTGKIDEGLELVDRVRAKRIEGYEPFKGTVADEKAAMKLLQKAKWIECLSTYENFFDCKRWNTENDYKRTITREFTTLDGLSYSFSIKPGSPLWIFPFPSDACSHNPSLTHTY